MNTGDDIVQVQWRSPSIGGSVLNLSTTTRCFEDLAIEMADSSLITPQSLRL
jgi:hypothetical protein